MNNSYYKKGYERAKTIGLDISDRSKRAPGGPLGGIMLGNQRRHEAQVHAFSDPKIKAKVQNMTADQLLKTASTFGLSPEDFGFDDKSAKGYQFDKTPQTASQIYDNAVKQFSSQPTLPESEQSQPNYSEQNYSNPYLSQQYDNPYNNQSYDNYYGYKKGGRVYKSEGGEIVKDMLVQQVLPTVASMAGEAVAGPVGGLAASVIASQMPSMMQDLSAHDKNMARFKELFPRQAAKLQALQNQHGREEAAQPYIEQAKKQYDFMNQVRNQDQQYQAQIQQLQQQLQNSQQQYNQPSEQNYSNYQDSDYSDPYSSQQYDDYYGYKQGGRICKSEGGEIAKQIVTQQVVPMVAGVAGEALGGPLGGFLASTGAQLIPGVIDVFENMPHTMDATKRIEQAQEARQNYLANSPQGQKLVKQNLDYVKAEKKKVADWQAEHNAKFGIDRNAMEKDFGIGKDEILTPERLFDAWKQKSQRDQQEKAKYGQYTDRIKDLESQLAQYKNSVPQSQAPQQNNYSDYYNQGQQEDPYYQDYYSDYQY